MTNPFFEPSTLPFGLPPFADITDGDYRPAFDRGLEEHLAEITAVADDSDPATFENTMIPLERGGQLLERVSHVFFNKSSADSNDFTNALEEEMAPLLAAHSDAIRLNSRLYDRIKSLYERRSSLGLDA
ncbi:MAG TPA: M3 family peptidase, partial [Galbitalea sp.]|nr:M3 family peptidase [Galbitalea sp.]